MRLAPLHKRSVALSVFAATILAVLGAGHTSQLAAQKQDTHEEAIRAVVSRYFHGLKFNDVASLRSAFWSDAKLLFVKKDGSLGQLSQNEWYAMFASSAGKEEEVDLRIVNIDVSGNAASVKVVETYPKSIYIDYLNLLQLNNKWTIVNKVYTSRSR